MINSLRQIYNQYNVIFYFLILFELTKIFFGLWLILVLRHSGLLGINGFCIEAVLRGIMVWVDSGTMPWK